MKQAQLQIQFNWIFVLVIGSILLIFFFTLIRAQSDSTEERISITQSKYFETIITATGQKEGTLKTYDIPNIEVEFECDIEDNLFGYSVENLPSRDTKYDILFTHEYLAGDDIQTWTQIWEVPFKAATFLYITNSKQGYIFYNHSDIIGLPEPTPNFDILYSGFPNISVEVVDTDFTFTQVNRRNYETNTYVFLYGEEPRNIPFDDDSINKIVIIRKGENAQELYDYGKIYYFTDDLFDSAGDKYNEFISGLEYQPTTEDLEDHYENQDHTSYLGKASMYGAIFSENQAIYDCNMQKAFRRLKLLTKLYYLRTDDLLNGYYVEADDGTQTFLLSNQCRRALGLYDETGSAAHFPFQRLYYLSEDLLNSSTSFTNDNVEEVHFRLFELDQNNKDISRLSRCPILY